MMKDDTSLIRLLSKPGKPVRKKRCKGKFSIDEGTDVESILDGLPDDVAYSDIRFRYDYEHDYGGGYTELYFEWFADEPSRVFEKRVESYKKKIKNYSAWYKKNEDLIVLEKKRRVKLKKGRDLKTLEQLEAKVRREMEALERQRKKMGEQ